MNRLDEYTGDTHKPKQSLSIFPFLLTGALFMFGLFVWATLQVGSL